MEIFENGITELIWGKTKGIFEFTFLPVWEKETTPVAVANSYPVDAALFTVIGYLLQKYCKSYVYRLTQSVKMNSE